jgi:ADP-ribose pyrophosphatase YjhB (NUDIX family)
MRPVLVRDRLAPAAPATVPLLDASDLPGDDVWSLPGAFASDDGSGDDDRYATLSVARAFDD